MCKNGKNIFSGAPCKGDQLTAPLGTQPGDKIRVNNSNNSNNDKNDKVELEKTVKVHDCADGTKNADCSKNGGTLGESTQVLADT